MNHTAKDTTEKCRGKACGGYNWQERQKTLLLPRGPPTQGINLIGVMPKHIDALH